MGEKRGSQRTKKKRKKIKKKRTRWLQRRHAFVSGRAQHDRGVTRDDMWREGDAWRGGDATGVMRDEGASRRGCE
jgi:hypothetical protein